MTYESATSHRMRHFPSSVLACLTLCAVLLSACSDTDPKSRSILLEEIHGRIDITFNAAASTIGASGRLMSKSPDVAQEFLSLFDNDSSLIRLVDGDAFYIDWGGNSYQLYRRSRDFTYRATIPFQPERNINARLKLAASSSFQQVAVAASLPDTASFQLAQTAQMVASDTNLTTSWNLDVDGADLASTIETVEILAQPTRCTDMNGMPVLFADAQSVASAHAADTTSSSLQISAADIIAPLQAQGLGVSSCKVNLQLQVHSIFQSSEENRANLELRAISISDIQPVTILDSIANGLSAGTGVYP